jgi:recombination protein RecR
LLACFGFFEYKTKMLPQPIENLAEKFRKFPGIGFRSSQKLALDILQTYQEDYQELLIALDFMRKNVDFCQNCGFFSQGKICDICSNKNRTDLQICLVEKPTDIITLERSESFRGKYHVLQNLISPLENIFPENTTLSDLFDHRIPQALNSTEFLHQNQKDTLNQTPNPIQLELILFFKAGFSAEATTAYLRETVAQKGWQSKIKITRLAQGLPLYYNPDTLDQATMIRALEDRREV